MIFLFPTLIITTLLIIYFNMHLAKMLRLAMSASVILALAYVFNPAFANEPTGWQTNLTGIHYSGGKVGVGTATPETLLNITNGVGGSFGLTQELLGGPSTLELTTADAQNRQTTRALIRGSNDYANLELYSGPLRSETNGFLFYGPNRATGLGQFVGSTSGNDIPKARLHLKEGDIPSILLEDEQAASGTRTFRIDVHQGKVNFQAMGDNGTSWQRNLMQLYHNGDICIGSSC